MKIPHEQQAAAMERAGELTDGEQLRECINSGQVSAAQVVAHAENGEFPPLPRPDRNAWPNGFHDLFTAEQMRAHATAALAAERAEVARLREALSDARNYIEATTLNASSRQTRDNYRGCLNRIDAALSKNQEEIEHE